MKDWKYILYVGGALALFVLVKLSAPRQYDWTITLASDDKDPYGAYVLNELLPDLFPDRKMMLSNKTVYELKDSIRPQQSLFILASGFSADKAESSFLLDHVSKGGTVFISAHYFRGHFADTLGVNTYDYFFKSGQARKDSSFVELTPVVDSTHYSFVRDNINMYFDEYDSLRTTRIARNDQQEPLCIRVTYGKGSFILNSTPLVFTNIYLMSDKHRGFAEALLSYLPKQDVYWTEFYQRGRMEAQTPLRYILTNEPLSWAYYIVVGSILLFMLFEAKRKQRIIPVIKSLPNTSLQFISTIGNLYFQNGDHKNAAEKKINFLLEQIRTKYFLKTNEFNDDFISALTNKSGNNKQDVEALFKKISSILSSSKISAEQLLDLNERIERFNKQSH